MKKQVVLFVVVLVIASLVSSCASPKPAYKTREGKKKLEHYNKLQYGQKM
jgi:hypothetical protein